MAEDAIIFHGQGSRKSYSPPSSKGGDEDVLLADPDGNLLNHGSFFPAHWRSSTFTSVPLTFRQRFIPVLRFPVCLMTRQ